ncbi:MAG: dethiobiotin synthase [Lysobacter sp.]|nr:MAG: dethiobiotin synthase [Lysobacter sp.]
MTPVTTRRTVRPCRPPPERHPVNRGLFITGTDTGVGKTRVACALAHALAGRGDDVRVRKPVESGCVDGPAGPTPADGMALRAAAGGHEPLDTVCRYRLQAPLSPERAARREGMPLTLAMLIDACLHGVDAESILLVEGAGGFLSPIAAGALNADLAVALGLPVLVVAADRLGTINHMLLTAEAIRARGLHLAGIVLNQPVAPVDDAMDNGGELARWLGIEVIRFPHGEDGHDAWQVGLPRLAALLDSAGYPPGDDPMPLSATPRFP